MIFLMTKDSFLLQGFWQLKDNHEMIKINSLSEIKKGCRENYCFGTLSHQ